MTEDNALLQPVYLQQGGSIAGVVAQINAICGGWCGETLAVIRYIVHSFIAHFMLHNIQHLAILAPDNLPCNFKN